MRHLLIAACVGSLALASVSAAHAFTLTCNGPSEVIGTGNAFTAEVDVSKSANITFKIEGVTPDSRAGYSGTKVHLGSQLFGNGEISVTLAPLGNLYSGNTTDTVSLAGGKHIAVNAWADSASDSSLNATVQLEATATCVYQ
jgi:hypothetical protein